MRNDEYCEQSNEVIAPEQECAAVFHRQVYTKPKLMPFGKLQGVTLGATGTEIDSPQTPRPFQR